MKSRHLKIVFQALLIIFMLLAHLSWAGTLMSNPKFQAFDSSGVPLAGGKLYSYLPGTTTSKATYSDRNLSTPNTNPVILDSRGEATIYGSGLYKLVLKDSSDVTIWTMDNVEFVGGGGSYNLYPNPSESDHGAAGNGSSLYDLLTALGTSKKATVAFTHNGSSNTTTYTVNTTYDISSYTNVTFQFENGALLSPAAGVTVTIYSPENINAPATQQIFDGDGSIAYSVPGHIYTGWYGSDTDAYQDAFGNANCHITCTHDVSLTDKITIQDGQWIDFLPGVVLTQTGTDKNTFYASSKNNITIDGRGGKLVGRLVTEQLTDRGLIHFDGCTDVRVTDLEVMTGFDLVWIANSDRVWVERNELHNYQRVALNGTSNTKFHFDKNTIYDNQETGKQNCYAIQATGDNDGGSPLEYSSINFNKITGPRAWDGIMSHDCDDLEIIGNVIKDVRQGIDVGLAGSTNIVKNVRIIGNYLEGTSTDTWSGTGANNSGIQISGQPVAGDWTDFDAISDVVVSDNIITGFNKHTTSAGNAGIFAQYIRNFSLTGNVIYGLEDNWTHGAGIVLVGATVSGTISGNTITAKSGETGPMNQGIRLYNLDLCYGVTVVGNTIADESGNMDYAIRVTGSNFIDAVVEKNNFYGFTTPYNFGATGNKGPLPFCDVGYWNGNAWANPVTYLGAKMRYYTATDKVDTGGLVLRKRIEDTIASVDDTDTITINGSTSNMAVGDVIHIFKDTDESSPYVHSTTIATIVDADTIDITGALGATTEVSAGNKIYVVEWEKPYASGTGTIASGTTSKVITHGLGFTPDPQDITITLIENPTNTPGAIWVDSIGDTTFTVNCENDPGASNLDFAWKYRK